MLGVVFICEAGILITKSDKSLQYEISQRKIDIMKDKPGVIRLLPGVGAKKIEEILEIRKEAKNAQEVIEKVGLSKKLLNEDSLIYEN